MVLGGLKYGDSYSDTHGVGAELLRRFLVALCESQGSDLHIKAGSPPRLRVNGELHTLAEAELTPQDTAAMAEAVLEPHSQAIFEERHEVDCAYSVPGVGRFRVNVFLQRGSVAMVLRRVVGEPLTIEQLGLPQTVARLASEPRGLVLVTGPTGSGKTTTLAAMVDYINRTRECHILTIEDPIEVLHKDRLASVAQREVGFDTPDFASAVRVAMRQDPDVILVGEMRDLETVQAALAAAETGHLVLSTLHTNDAQETIVRICDFFPPHQQKQVRMTLASCLRGTIGQRLVPTADGQGRVAALEIMVVTGRVQTAILEPGSGPDIRQIVAEGEYYGMRTFDQSLCDLVQEGRITVAAAFSAATNPHDLRLELARKGLVKAAAG
jgi:twitching motility protein PilT